MGLRSRLLEHVYERDTGRRAQWRLLDTFAEIMN